MPTAPEIATLEVCTTCLFMLANGRDERLTETETEQWAADFDAKWSGWHVTPGCGHESHYWHDGKPTDDNRQQCEEESFSWSHCQGCGSTLGGGRHPASAWPVANLDATRKVGQ